MKLAHKNSSWPLDLYNGSYSPL